MIRFPMYLPLFHFFPLTLNFLVVSLVGRGLRRCSSAPIFCFRVFQPHQRLEIAKNTFLKLLRPGVIDPTQSVSPPN